MSDDVLSKIYYCMERVVVLEGIDDVLNHIVTTAASLTQADAASLRLFNIKSGNLDLKAGTGLSQEFLRRPPLALGEGIIGRVVQDCAAYKSNDARNDPRCCQKDVIEDEGINAILSVPLKNRQTALGSLTVYRRSRLEFTDSELLLMSIFAAQAVEAVEKTEQLEALRRQATVDSLTNTYNRKFLRNRIDEELKRTQRHNHPLSLIFIDLDDFKNFNDQHGHLLGDKLLKDFVDLLRSGLRKNDFMGRLGGDEFLVVVPETDKAGALALTEKLREAVAGHSFMGSDGAMASVRFSAGIASYPEDGLETEELIQRSDEAMYVVKNRGKNGIQAVAGD